MFLGAPVCDGARPRIGMTTRTRPTNGIDRIKLCLVSCPNRAERTLQNGRDPHRRGGGIQCSARTMDPDLAHEQDVRWHWMTEEAVTTRKNYGKGLRSRKTDGFREKNLDSRSSMP